MGNHTAFDLSNIGCPNLGEKWKPALRIEGSHSHTPSSLQTHVFVDAGNSISIQRSPFDHNARVSLGS